MTPERLQAFVAVVEYKGFTTAADALYTSQSALSQQIRTLEKSLGFDLFDHKSRRFSLTSAGQAFYPRAKQLLSLYHQAVTEAKVAQEGKPMQPLRVGCLYDQITQYWLNLFHLSPEVEERYKPTAMRFPDRMTLYHEIQRGNVDICVQIENASIADFQLEFMPLITCRELVISLYSSVLFDKEELTLKDLDAYRVAIHYPPGYVLYEDYLRIELERRRGDTMIFNPSDFPHVEYGIPIVLLMPEIRFPKDKLSYARPLAWGDGVRVGFVLKPDCRENVRRYAEEIKGIIEEKGNPW